MSNKWPGVNYFYLQLFSKLYSIDFPHLSSTSNWGEEMSFHPLQSFTSQCFWNISYTTSSCLKIEHYVKFKATLNIVADIINIHRYLDSYGTFNEQSWIWYWDSHMHMHPWFCSLSLYIYICSFQNSLALILLLLCL